MIKHIIKDGILIHEFEKDFRLTLTGTGAMDSPRKDESLLVSHKGHNVLIDAGKKIRANDLPELDAILVCDDKSRYMNDAKRIGEAFDLVPEVGEFSADDLKIIPFPVKHTKHNTYGYRIEAQGKKIIYAPEFYVFPSSEVKNAEVAILEGSAWNKPITFAGGVGGHAAILDTWEKAKKAGIKRIIFTHIGKPVERNMEEAKEMGIEIGEDGQVIEIEKIEKAVLSPGDAFTPLKSRGGYGKYEFADVKSLWTIWAQGYIPDPGVAVETKIDGFRVQIHKWDESVKVISEDAKRDLSPKLLELAKEIKSIKGSCILDGELTVYIEDKKIERKDMPTYIMADKPPPFKAKIDVFDCLYRDGETLVNNPWTDRQEALDAIFAGIDELLLNRLKPTITKNKDDFLEAIKKHSGEPHSEGAMCKVVNSKYPLTGETSEWAKYKHLKEVRCRVVGKKAKKGGGFIYTCELKGGIPIGRTYSTKIDVSVGDILEVAVAEVKYDEEEDKFTWDNPIVRSKKPAGTELTTKEQAKALARLKRTRKEEGGEFGNITFEVGDKGKGIAQVHIMGLSEEEIGKLKKETTRIMIARGSIEKLEATLKGAIGDHGAHVDMRLRRGKENEWQGNEIFIGNISGLSKLSELKEGKRKLRAPWKQSRVDEPKTEAITGPLGWMEAGARKIDTFAPGTPGATANKWGAMIRIDSFDWEMYLADEHAKKLHLTGSKFFDGNWLFAYVPITEAGKKGERIWMISKLKDSDYEETIEEKAEKLDIERFRAEGIDEDIANPEERYRQLMAGLRYLGNSGYPKLKAGKPWGDWTLKDLLRYFAKVVDILRSIYFPVMPPKMGDPKFKTSYWQCYREARKHMKSRPPEKGEVKEWEKKRKELIKKKDILDKEEIYVPIFKVSEEEHIVGGIVYEPMKEDVQGDYATEKEIRDACYYYMEYSRKFKLQHKGRPITEKINLLENYLAPEDFEVNKQKVRKGSWILIIRILDADVWKDIKEEKVTGFSMAGLAHRRKVEKI